MPKPFGALLNINFPRKSRGTLSERKTDNRFHESAEKNIPDAQLYPNTRLSRRVFSASRDGNHGNNETTKETTHHPVQPVSW